MQGVAGSSSSERLRCNICELEIDMGEAAEHAGSQAHAARKERLEQELRAAKEEKQAAGGNETSVAGRWAGGDRGPT